LSNLILAIDDDRDILKVLRANLELHGYAVDTADSWTRGHELLLQREPSLILLDIMLPDGDGFEICQHLKREHPKIPIIMLTAKDKVSDKVFGLESGADDYVVKPFETLELLARIKACLRRIVPSSVAEEIHTGNIRINCKKHLVTVSGKPVDLTPKEFELLCFFLNHRGEVLGREAIRKQLWKGSQIYSWSRVIDVHIQHLRQKLEKDPSNPVHIITVPGAGYRFAE
jgi:DNA-binding response OmpR family regulator